MRCLPNSAFLFFDRSGRKSVPQRGFGSWKAGLEGSESQGVERIEPGFPGKRSKHLPKMLTSFRGKCLLLFEISPNVFPDYSYCFRLELQKRVEFSWLLLRNERSGNDKETDLWGNFRLWVPLFAETVLSCPSIGCSGDKSKNSDRHRRRF